MVADLLAGKGIYYLPSQHVNVTFKKAPRAAGKKAAPRDLPFGDKE